MRRTTRLGRVVPLFAIVSAAALGTAGSAVAGGDDTPTDEQADVAVPIPPAELAAQQASVPPRPAAVGAAAAAIDDFRYDDLVVEGTAAEVCHGRIRQGTMWTFQELTERFGGWAGTMYACRERWNLAEDPDCNGTTVDPVSQPDFHSTCWSNHAQGRALDIMVGSAAGGGYNTARGLAIVDWLLAADAAGNQNALARRLGVQQILFADRCWNSDGDRGIAVWTEMRECGIGHFDHVHIDMTLPGSEGGVSYWGAAPEVAPKHNSVLEWDRESGRWTTREFVNGVEQVGRTSTWPTGPQQLISGDWDADGRTDDVISWDPGSGRWQVRAFGPDGVTQRASGQWSTRYDRIVAGDFNADGKINDLFFHDAETGRWAVQSWWGYAVGRAATGQWDVRFSDLAVGDLNDNGLRNDLLLWDQAGRTWRVVRWVQRAPWQRATGTWGGRFDRLVVGDFDAGGDFDETLLWDRDANDWYVQEWDRARPTTQGHGSFGPATDDLVLADFDTDGRIDDALARNTATGRWTMLTWHRFVRSTVRTGAWPGGNEQIVAGTWE